MIKISDFSPHIARSNTDHNSSCANCKVIINNNDGKVHYPDPEEIDQVELKTREVSIEEPSNNLTELYQHLASTFSNILKSNNMKLIANIIDQSGKIIINANDLVQAISLILNIDFNLIKLSYEDPEPSCLKHVSPIKKISSIKINGLDFKLQYNKEFNILEDQFNISLEKVIIF